MNIEIYNLSLVKNAETSRCSVYTGAPGWKGPRKFEYMENLYGALHDMQLGTLNGLPRFCVMPTSKRWVEGTPLCLISVGGKFMCTVI